jgi:hypothetical protein
MTNTAVIDILDLPRDEDMDMGGRIKLDDTEEDASHTSDDDDNDDDDNDDDDDDDNDDDNDDDSDDENNDNDGIDGVEQNNTAAASDDDVSIPGVRRSRRKNKGKMTRHAAYGLMMAARRRARGGECRAIIREGVMFFSNDHLNDAKPVPVEDREDWILGVALAQYLITAGLKKFKEKGKAGVTKELTQMHNMNVFKPIFKEALNKEEWAKALASLMFLKEKRDKMVKALMCADGRKQHGDWTKQELTSPTVSTESVFITAVVGAHEE